MQKSEDEVGELSFALNDMSESLQRGCGWPNASRGDLDLEVRLSRPGAQAVWKMVETLERLDLPGAGQRHANHRQLAQVTELSQSLSDLGASNSASSITEISAVAAQMAAQTNDNAANAKGWWKSQASRADAESDKLMSGVIAAMVRSMISRFQDILAIITTIDNMLRGQPMLALNAADQAAHGNWAAVSPAG